LYIAATDLPEEEGDGVAILRMTGTLTVVGDV
jgi:hypothetical protein